MSVKLSELLETSALCISSMADDHRIRKSSGSGEQRLLTRERALRAIAPALVEIAQASQQFSELHGGIESTHIPDYCPACRLVCAMKAAGVMCD